MPSTDPSSTFRSTIGRLALIVLAGGALAACDGHPSTEVPESYGHGSTRNGSYKDHQVDSRLDSRHFSDSQGTVSEDEAHGGALPGATPAGTPGGHFF